jgi:hypothetical protein
MTLLPDLINLGSTMKEQAVAALDETETTLS